MGNENNTGNKLNTNQRLHLFKQTKSDILTNIVASAENIFSQVWSPDFPDAKKCTRYEKIPKSSEEK